jgi:hypothetical protein
MCAQNLSVKQRSVMLNLQELPLDVKRMLRVQVKELIHMIEDREFDSKAKMHNRSQAA